MPFTVATRQLVLFFAVDNLQFLQAYDTFYYLDVILGRIEELPNIVDLLYVVALFIEELLDLLDGFWKFTDIGKELLYPFAVDRLIPCYVAFKLPYFMLPFELTGLMSAILAVHLLQLQLLLFDQFFQLLLVLYF